jgi:hypothetical protein
MAPIADFLLRINSALALCLLFFSLSLFVELGFRAGLLFRARVGAEKSDVIQQGLITLLALLLAFGVTIAESRYENRKQTLINEANAIGTSYLRCSLFSNQDEKRLEDLLLRYLDLRIAFYGSNGDPHEIQTILSNTTTLQKTFWAAGAEIGRKNPTVLSSLFLSSLNETIDLQSKQEFAYEYKVPRSILFLLALTASLVLGLVGYSHGLTNKRHILFTGMMTVLITMTLFVIIDLDRPRGGFIRLSPKVLVELKHQLSP